MSSPSGLLPVTMETAASDSTRWVMSTSLPSTLAASAARARPAPIEAAISATVIGPGNDFDEPSGRRMLGIAHESLHTSMMKLPLSLAIGPYDHTRELRPEGIELTRLDLPIEEIFFRFTKFREWDVSEMSFGKIISLMSEARPPIVALPVFVSRVFRHSAIYVADAKKIRAPKDLEGKRVGIPEWAQTAGIYVRGMLQHEYGVDLAKIDWRQAGVREAGRVEKVELRLPPGVKIQAMPQHTLAGMLAAGELDAAISARDPGGTRLFANHRELEADYFRKTRIFPIMHVVVVRREAYERDRWIAMNLFKAFEEAKQTSVARVADIGAS